MKLKKAVALLCTAGMLMGLLSGCGNSDGGSSNTQNGAGGHQAQIPALVLMTVKVKTPLTVELLMEKLSR